MMRLGTLMIGKLGEKEIREQRAENEGVTGGERIFFAGRGLTGEEGQKFLNKGVKDT